MTVKNNKKPVWLEKRWESRKKETVERVRNAVEALENEGSTVSVRRICDKVREQTGYSLSPNTVKQNSGAHEIYRQYASRRVSCKIKEPTLMLLLGECPEPKRIALQAKINRLKLLSKDDLMVRLIKINQELKESRQVENRLRERLFELELFVHRNKKKQ